MQPGSAGNADPSQGAPKEDLGPIARMMMSVAGQAITGYVQFRALVELLIAKGVFSRDELEELFEQSRATQLERTIDEWFPSDIAYHIKMAMQSAESAESAESDAAAGAAAYQGSAVPSEVDEIARARAMQSTGEPPTSTNGSPGAHGTSTPNGQ